MYQAKTIRTVGETQSPGTPPMPPLYHWFGADAERVAEQALAEAKTRPFYYWLGAEAEEMLADVVG